MKNILDRIRQIVENESTTITALERQIGASKGVLSGAILKKTDIQSKWVQKIAENFPLYSTEWLLTGEGEMLKSETNNCTEDVAQVYHKNPDLAIFKPEDLPLQVGRLYRAPIYESYPVSAGDMGLSSIRSDKPDGYAYTTMPGVTFFPVVGCSFEPIIEAGRYIGVVKIDNWDRIDTEKIYFIVTRDERMIKRLRTDDDDNNVFWCVSPNFREFKIYKSEIIEINHVFFYGRMV